MSLRLVVTLALATLCVGLLSACSSGEKSGEKTLTSSECANSFLSTEKAVLDQSEQPLGQLQSATQLPNGRIVVSTDDPGVFLFESDGTFIRQIGQSGRGPSEYQNPSVARPYGSNIAIWDAGNMKVTVYDQAGDSVEEWTGFTWGVADFAIRDGVFYSYYASVDAPYIRIWDLEAEEMIAEYDDSASVKRAALSHMEGSGDLALHDDALYALDPASPSVQRYDVAEGRVARYPLDDDAFTLADLEASSIDELDAQFADVMQFGLSSSRSYQVFTTESAVLAVLQHGFISYDAPLFENERPNADARMESYDRYLHVHQMTHDGDATQCERIDIDIERTQNDAPILGPTPHGFLYHEVRSTDDDVEYVLTEYMLPQ